MLQIHGVEFPWLIVAHFTAASLALLLGLVQLFGRKGTARHRLRGRVWVGLMAFVAISSFWVLRLSPGHFSWIHLLSIWTLICLPSGIYLIRRGNIRGHRNFMVGTFIGLVIAGGFALFGEDRLLHTLLFNRLLG